MLLYPICPYPLLEIIQDYNSISDNLRKVYQDFQFIFKNTNFANTLHLNVTTLICTLENDKHHSI